jgi:hypothetical protein
LDLQSISIRETLHIPFGAAAVVGQFHLGSLPSGNRRKTERTKVAPGDLSRINELLSKRHFYVRRVESARDEIQLAGLLANESSFLARLVPLFRRDGSVQAFLSSSD